ncbi:MAG: c-type cytochrome [Gammaproteobacteria bacterium]|nr:c-type cytochrome [Gammaproteobacteria bacterium]
MTLVRYLPLAVFTLAIANLGFASETLAGEVPKYTVKEGKVDKGTYNGYRRFHGTCHVCHGQDAMGSSFAPSLVESLKTVDYETFVKTVMEGRQVTDATGAVKAMPSFGNDPNVTKHLDDIYRYLSARSDGVLAPGRPKKIPK